MCFLAFTRTIIDNFTIGTLLTGWFFTDCTDVRFGRLVVIMFAIGSVDMFLMMLMSVTIMSVIAPRSVHVRYHFRVGVVAVWSMNMFNWSVFVRVVTVRSVDVFMSMLVVRMAVRVSMTMRVVAPGAVHVLNAGHALK